MRILFLIIVFGCQLSAQNENDIINFRHSISYNANEFDGAGWEKLVATISKKEILVIGEDHGLAEIPLFTKQMSLSLKPHGFTNYLGEFGKFSSQKLIKMINEGEQRTWLKENLGSIPFMNWEEELDLIENLSKNNFSVFGVDQEFLLSSIIHFNSLYEIIEDENGKSLIAKLIDSEIKGIDKFFMNGNYLDLFMVSSLESDFEYLKNRFKSKRAIQIIEHLQISFKIYRKMMNGDSKGSNSIRAELMQKNFEEILSHSQNKTILKIGALHAYRESPPTEVNEIGSYIANNMDSFHILILGNKGTYNNSTAQTAFDEKYENVGYNIKKRFPTDLSLFLKFSGLSKKKWSYFDLKGMRDKNMNLPEDLNRLIRAFDALIIIPEVSASKSLK